MNKQLEMLCKNLIPGRYLEFKLKKTGEEKRGFISKAVMKKDGEVYFKLSKKPPLISLRRSREFSLSEIENPLFGELPQKNSPELVFGNYVTIAVEIGDPERPPDYKRTVHHFGFIWEIDLVPEGKSLIGFSLYNPFDKNSLGHVPAFLFYLNKVELSKREH